MPLTDDSRSSVSSWSPAAEPLAVIGIGCRLPGGIDSPDTFWKALLEGVNAIREVPEDRWRHAWFHDPDPEKSGNIRNAKGGFIEGIDQFDGEFFGYFPTEAQRIDPQQRLLLEVAHEAMEDAGLRREQLQGSRTSVFVGSFMYDYLCIQSASDQRDEINPYVAMGAAVSPLSNRLSYDFDLKGPSISVDTACSSSLVALHLACRSLWGGEADLAIAGGVNLMLRPESSIMLSKAGFLNPDQSCKAFDAARNGYVRGEGVGVVILKPLRRALADGDAIYACVRGTGVNQDGFLPEGFTVPNVFSQIALLESVYGQTEVDPLQVDFVEAHGTGTPIGDVVETLALGALLGRERAPDDRNLMIGSVKTNLGHLEGAAGITGFIKAALVAHHGIAPPNLHFHNPNPEILWDDLRLEVPTQPTPLPRRETPRIVGVNSFGAGGTNVHVILEEPAAAKAEPVAPSATLDPRASRAGIVYVLSSRHRDALRTLALRHAELLQTSQHAIEDLAFSAFTRRSRYPHLLAVVGDSASEIETKLRNFADGQLDPTILATKIARQDQPSLAFVFSGQGGQWARMGLELFEREPVFRECVERIDACFYALAGWSLLDEMRRDEGESSIDDTVVVQPSVMAVQIGLVHLYAHYGIHAEAAVGHSIGEVAAAYAAGALTLEQAVAVIYERSQAQHEASGMGGMLAVGLSPEEAGKLIAPYEGRVSIGAVNGPEMVTLSGDFAPLEEISGKLETRRVFHRRVNVQVPYHSHHMEPIRERMLAALAELKAGPATIALYSTVTGQRQLGQELGAEYWYRNVRQTVQFAAALTSMLNDGINTFLEIGPHPVLVRGAEALFQKLNADALIAPAMTRREPEPSVFLQSLAQLAVRGIAPDTPRLFGAGRRYVRLPKMPWQHQRYWFESPAVAESRRGRFANPFLKRCTQMVTEDGLAVWDATVDVHKFPYLSDHVVDGEIVFPASGHIELAWAAASEQFPHESFFLEDLHFDLPLILPDNNRHPLEVHLEVVSNEGDYHICSRPADGRPDATWTKHSSGRINTLHDRFDEVNDTLEELQERFEDAEVHDVAQFYQWLEESGLAYGGRFRCVHDLRHSGSDWLAQVQLPEELAHEAQRNLLHPALLDACLHVVFADVHRQGFHDRAYLPYRMHRIRFHRRPSRTVWSHVRITRDDDHYLGSDTWIYDESGQLVAEILGITCKRLVGAGARQIDTAYEGCYEFQWQPAPVEPEHHGRIFDCRNVILLADESAAATELTSRLAGEDIATHRVGFDDASRLEQLLTDIPLDRRTAVVFGAGLAVENVEWSGLGKARYVPSLLELARQLQRREGVPRVLLVTRGAGAVDGDGTLDLAQAILHGMARVISNECPNVPITVIDLAAGAGQEEVDAFYFELLHRRRDRDESEIAFRDGIRYTRRLVRLDRETAERAAMTEEPGCGGEYYADLHEPGLLEEIRFRRRTPVAPGAHEVEIAVEAAALNFKDVMNAMGLLPAEAVEGGLAGARLGLEVAGHVIRTGSHVRHVQPGDSVLARVADGFGGRVVAPGTGVARRPEHLSSQQAAGVPVAFITAWYSLGHLARLERGETVLIHSAAGGVGCAAVQLAHRAGASVIATAGTREKREFLRGMGVAHVFDSRSLDFHNKVLEATDGKGVDVVLNSLAGRFITQSLKCLAPFGRFIELGKSDIYRNNKLALKPLGENISYFVVDVDRLATHKPELHQRLLAEIVELFERGELQPHEITTFPISKLAEAMKLMTRAAYRGKLVMNMVDDRVPALPPRQARLQPDRTYLITGGASGFGLELARWMVDHGARHLVLASRTGPKSPAEEEAVEALRRRGAHVWLARVDVATRAEVDQLLGQMEQEMPRLAGLVHAAAVLDDASISTMTMSRFARVFQPKAEGAWNLHAATREAGIELDFFIMLSSISSILGLVGQVNYAAANCFQDALACYRRQQGLAGSSLNLGVLGQYAGMSRIENDKQDVVQLLAHQGLETMPLTETLAKFEAALLQQPVQRMMARLQWSRFRTAYPHLVQDVKFRDVISDAALARGSQSKGSNLRSSLAELEPGEQQTRLENEIRSKLSQILDANPDKLEVGTSIDALGLDSLMLTDLQVWIARSLDINVPIIKLLKGPSITALARELVSQLNAGGKHAAGGAPDPSEDASAFTVADMDDIQILNPWLIRGRTFGDEPLRLICFHSMGVGAALFTKFLLSPPDDFDVLAVQTPGRENRASEPVADSVEQLADRIAPLIAPLFDRPVVVWGHSYGGIVAREVVARLSQLAAAKPVHFLVTGTVSPHLIHLWQKREVMLQAMVADNSPDYLISLSRYVDDPEFLKSIIPLMRRDWPLLKNYRYEPGFLLPCPITAFAARQDDMVYTDEIREWAEHTRGPFRLIEVDGDHWFLNRNRDQINAVLQEIAALVRTWGRPRDLPPRESSRSIIGERAR